MLIAKNRKAFHEYEVLEKYTAGIILAGYEVKAIKEGKVNFDGSFVQIIGGVPTVVNMYVGHYSKQSQPFNENMARKSRQLLLKKAEVEAIFKELSQKGKTAVPLALVLSHNMVKLEFGIVRGLKKFEKKQIEKDRQIQADMRRELAQS